MWVNPPSGRNANRGSWACRLPKTFSQNIARETVGTWPILFYSKTGKTSNVSLRMKRYQKSLLEVKYKADQNTTGVNPCVFYIVSVEVSQD